ncbi:MAG: hypothetical protein AAFY26_20825, partial [Cyanobacteria bacterium J06638_22]
MIRRTSVATSFHNLRRPEVNLNKRISLTSLAVGGRLLLSSTLLLAGQTLLTAAHAAPVSLTEPGAVQLAQGAEPTPEAEPASEAEPIPEAESMLPIEASLEPGTYTNHFFEFTIQFPESWAIADQTVTDEMQEVGLDVLAGEDETLRTLGETALVRTYNLLTISPYPLGAPVESNPNLVVIAERVSATPGIQTGEDYLFHLQRWMEAGEVPYNVLQGPYTVDLGGQTFYRLDAALDLFGFPVYQSYLATIDSGYALTLILSGFEGEMEQLDAIAESMQ